MPKATEPNTTTASADPPWAISDIESLLHDLEAQTGILGHVANSGNAIDPGELILIQDQLFDLHKQLTEAWSGAWDEWVAGKSELAAAQRAVRAAKDEYGVPGSKTDIRYAEMMWRMLAAAAGSITEGYEKRNERIAAAAAQPDAEPIATPAEDSPDAALTAPRQDIWAGATS